MTTVPAAWMPRATLKRIIVHWTGGTHAANAKDRKHYHILIEGDGELVRGAYLISANAGGGPMAEHTRASNTGSIGVSLCCMGGPDVREDPFNAGRWPMTRVQWDRLVLVCADLCRAYDIAPTPTTLLSHAEVQANLGIWQRQKWDYTRLAFDPSIRGAKAIGDRLRRQVKAAMGAPMRLVPESAPVDAEPQADAPADDVQVVPQAPLLVRQWTTEQVEGFQRRLAELGYDPGGIDGRPGPLTKGAVTRMQAVNGVFPASGELDVATADLLMGPNVKPMQVSAERAAASSAEIAAKVPVAKEARRSLLSQVWTWVAGVVTLLVSNARQSIGDAIETVKPVTDAIGNIPQGVVIAGISAVAVVSLYSAWRANRRADDAYRQGKLG